MSIQPSSPISLFMGFAYTDPRIGIPSCILNPPKVEDKVNISAQALQKLEDLKNIKKE